MLIWTLYIIYSSKRARYYIGVTSDILQRIKEHNTGLSPYTKGGSPWILKHKEEFRSIEEAYARERFLKNKKSRKIIEMVVRSPDVRLEGEIGIPTPQVVGTQLVRARDS